MSKKLKGNLMLLLTALIWGSSFVAQRAGMEYIGPFTFNVLRSLIGGLTLIPVILIIGRSKSPEAQEAKDASESQTLEKDRKTLLLGGVCCGLALFIACSLQQVGIVYTTAGKAGFITALYIVLVPILGVFIGKKVRPIIWFCIVLSVAGLYLLCMKDGFSLSRGDFLVLLCALFFSIHILVIDHFSPKASGVKLSCIQFFVCGILSLIPASAFEEFNWGQILSCWVPILYSGVLSCGVAYTLQIVAQKNTEPAVASLLLSLESVFAVISGVLILHESITLKEFCGCAIMFIAIIVAQLPSKEERLAASSYEEV